MTQVHKVVETTVNRFEVDADHGVVQRVARLMKPAGDDRIKHGDETFEVQPDGTFELPEHVAAHFLRQPGWHEGPSPFAPDERDEKPSPRGRKVG